LTNMHNEPDLGLLEIMPKDRKRSIVQGTQKQVELERKKI